MLQSPPELKPHLFPYLQSGAEGELNSLYRRVVTTMLAIHEGSQEPGDLIHIAQLWWVWLPLPLESC